MSYQVTDLVGWRIQFDLTSRTTKKKPILQSLAGNYYKADYNSSQKTITIYLKKKKVRMYYFVIMFL